MAISDADIQAYVQANINNPGAIAAAAEQYGVSLDDLTRATGYDAGTVNNYFQQANVSPYWQQQTQPEPIAAPVAPEPPAQPTYTAPEPPASVPSYARGGGRVLEDTSSFGSNVGNFGELDYYGAPQSKTEPTPPPAPTQPQAMTPPAPVAPVAQAAPVAPVAQAAPTVTPPKSLVEQILGQGTTSKWTGQGFGSAEANAADMAKILSGIGITDISQFGKITKEVPASSYETESGTVEVPATTYTTYGNKLTGQEVPNTYGERQTGDAFGGTYAGKGNTGYRVQFDEKGNPFFYTSAQSSSDAGQWMPIVQLALAATGAGGLLGNALLGSGAGAVATNALGNAIVSGALTGAAGGDVLKGALLGGAGGALGGYLQESGLLGGSGSGSTTSPTGGIDGSNIDFNDLAETNVIDSLKAQGLSNKQIAQWMENASAADLGYVPPTDAVTGAVAPSTDVLGDFINQQGLTTITPDAGTINITGTAPVTTPVVPTMVDPSVLAAVTNQLNNSLNTPTPEIKITGDKTTKTTDTTDTTVPTVTVVGDLPVVGPQVPTVEVVGDKVVKTDDSTVPTVEVVGDKPVKPVTPEVPTVEIVDIKPVKPVVPEVVITPEPEPPIVEPPVVPPVIVPPVVLPPPPPPPPPVVVPPVTPEPPATSGYGLNPGLIETTPFYNTTNDAQAKYYWGDHGFQSGPAFNAASYNAVAAPETPWGAQGVAKPLSPEDYLNLAQGLPIQQQQFTPATRVQAYNPQLLQTPVGQVNVGSTSSVAGPVAPTTKYDMTNAEVQQVSSVLGPVTAQALALAMANGDQATIDAIKSQYDYALQQQQNQGGL